MKKQPLKMQNHQEIFDAARLKYFDHREIIAKNPNTTEDVFRILLKFQDESINMLIANNRGITKNIALHLVSLQESGLTYVLLKNKGLTRDILNSVGRKLISRGIVLKLIQEHPNTDLGLKNSLILDLTIVKILYN